MNFTDCLHDISVGGFMSRESWLHDKYTCTKVIFKLPGVESLFQYYKPYFSDRQFSFNVYTADWEDLNATDWYER